MSTRDALPQIIRTQRLTLRAPALSDLAELVRLANNWKVVEPTAVMPFPYGQDDGHAFLSTVDEPDKPRSYAMADSADQWMGVVSLKFEPGKPPELGYWLGEPYWGRGYASEAVQGLLAAAHATGEIGEVRARVLAHNRPSIRVLEKCGFSVTEHATSIVERHRGKPLLIMSRRAA